MWLLPLLVGLYLWARRAAGGAGGAGGDVRAVPAGVRAAREFALKPGVDLGGLAPPMLEALRTARSVYAQRGADLVVTSGRDGKHMDGSRHYTGEAVDLRIWTLPEVERAPAAAQIGRELGQRFDVLLESDHIHIELDP